MVLAVKGLHSRSKDWRRERDSNPRARNNPDSCLAGKRYRPLSHLSNFIQISKQYIKSVRIFAFYARKNRIFCSKLIKNLGKGVSYAVNY